MKYQAIFFTALMLCAANAQAESCTFAFGDAPKLTWTGYKFSEKSAVPGTFDKIDWSQNKEAGSLSELISSVKFSVDASSVNSKDPGRDLTLRTKFFALNQEKGNIAGQGKSYDMKSNKAVATLTFNGVKRDIAFDVQTKDDTITFSTAIDILKDFQMNKAYESVAEACKPLHTGKDGKAVTWSEVGIEIVAKVVKTCS